ncbi:hypothetical protein IWW55_006724 [Coemansia sp. RSA 2706]|nr:hypothetical protein LPJ70_000432 [Coemansia sp. RSA 2708]KAJ2287437.1 hypothetical protein IWW55_006724 [Coemansia sp. RSA 2706]KAJ2305735.1 hypothetical protein IWW54_004982 [Coemansia sp. RSA 2705]KAJ2307370.1 hypothetical protein IWW52_006064 [Coemansia sp. RSA 2704]KAJ2329120.1 hypothetical protein IWW51_000792 [Coemansia sp. RSA 2702]KAJ2362577.1 hypothetical protein H4S01_004714 [Coemansia sp. RSA 2610]KAJ2381825.1 hypothetical protein H4S02_006040 [Coemansia sp. RSA 2611]KAJ271340
MFKNTVVALAALASTSFAAPADLPTDLADMSLDTASLMSMANDPGFQSSMSAAMNSLSAYLSDHPGVMESLSSYASNFATELANDSVGGDDKNTDTSGAASIKSAAMAAVGLSLMAALF